MGDTTLQPATLRDIHYPRVDGRNERKREEAKTYALTDRVGFKPGEEA